MLCSIVPPFVLGIIPARYAAQRFPGKPLAKIADKPMLQHVWERASQSRYLREVIIATDDERIASAARAFGAPARMTRGDHQSGTDRAAEVAAGTKADVIVNIQGDEPLIDPSAIDAALLCLLDDPNCGMATLKKKIWLEADINNPNVVKVVTDHHGFALYFSRSAIPHRRGEGAVHFKHIGLYVYRRDVLLGYPALKPGMLERAEKLEQLRALENGIPIRVAETDYDSVGVDTPEDLEAVERLFTVTARNCEDA